MAEHVGTVNGIAERAVTFNGIAEGVTFNDAGWLPTARMELEQ